MRRSVTMVTVRPNIRHVQLPVLTPTKPHTYPNHHNLKLTKEKTATNSTTCPRLRKGREVITKTPPSLCNYLPTVLDDVAEDTVLTAGIDTGALEDDTTDTAEDTGNPLETDTEVEVKGTNGPAELVRTDATTAVPGITKGVEAELGGVAISR